jgi:hypothetical protein
LKQLAGIKDEPKPKEEKKKKRAKSDHVEHAAKQAPAAHESSAVRNTPASQRTKADAPGEKHILKKHAHTRPAPKASAKVSAQRKKSARR